MSLMVDWVKHWRDWIGGEERFKSIDFQQALQIVDDLVERVEELESDKWKKEMDYQFAIRVLNNIATGRMRPRRYARKALQELGEWPSY